MSRRRTIRSRTRFAFVAGGVVLVSALGLATASAHVEADAPDARAGAPARITLEVPNESNTALTVEVAVALQVPAGTVVRPVAPAGWSVSTSTGATPVVVTWTADLAAAGIPPGARQAFVVRVNPLPDADSLSLPTVQTYDDGEVARWIEPPAPDGSEPEYPAPTIELLPAKVGGPDARPSSSPSGTPSDTSGGSSEGAPTSAAPAPASSAAALPTPAAAASVDPASTWSGSATVAVVGVVILLVLAAGAFVLVRRRFS